MLFKVVTLLVAVFFSGLLWLGWRQRDWKLGMVNFTGMALNIGVVILDFRAQLDIAAAMAAFLALVAVFIADIFLFTHEPPRPAAAPIFEHATSATARPQEQPSLTLEHLARACQLDPEMPEAWLNYGRALLARKKFSEALAAFDQAVALQPNMLEPWIFRANTLVHLGQNETAVQSYDAALCLNANRAECWNNRGVALSKMGKWPEAIASFERALKIQSEHYPASLNRMLAVDKLGRFDLARQHYRNFLKRPAPAVNGNLVFIRSRLQQLEGNTPPRLDFPQLEFELAV